jgi:hypothetical protein
MLAERWIMGVPTSAHGRAELRGICNSGAETREDGGVEALVVEGEVEAVDTDVVEGSRMRFEDGREGLPMRREA